MDKAPHVNDNLHYGVEPWTKPLLMRNIRRRLIKLSYAPLVHEAGWVVEPQNIQVQEWAKSGFFT